MLIFLSQILSYSILTWGVFLAITFVGTRFGRWLGLIAAQILIALTVTWLDFLWLRDQSQMPNWNGSPDLDPAFYMGLLPRIVLINTVLLPVAFYAFALRKKTEIRLAAQP